MSTLDLESLLTPARTTKMKAVLSQRIAWLTIVLDDVFDPHNISAVLRSCEAFGIQDVHVIESVEIFVTNPEVSHGTEKWLTIHHWPDYESCFTYLRSQYFVIYSTGFSDTALSLFDVPVTKPLAIVFGNEKRGVDCVLKDRCDGEIMIPMSGFVQSLNISVAAAVTIATLGQSIHTHIGEQALLPSERRNRIYTEWLERQVHESRRNPGQQ